MQEAIKLPKELWRRMLAVDHDRHERQEDRAVSYYQDILFRPLREKIEAGNRASPYIKEVFLVRVSLCVIRKIADQVFGDFHDLRIGFQLAANRGRPQYLMKKLAVHDDAADCSCNTVGCLRGTRHVARDDDVNGDILEPLGNKRHLR